MRICIEFMEEGGINKQTLADFLEELEEICTDREGLLIATDDKNKPEITIEWDKQKHQKRKRSDVIMTKKCDCGCEKEANFTDEFGNVWNLECVKEQVYNEQ